MKKRSFSFQVTFAMACLLVGTVLVCWLLNTFFLENYYVSQKEKSLISAFAVVEKASAEGALGSDEFAVVFDSLCATDNLDIMILRPDGLVIKSSAASSQELREQFLNAVFMQGADPEKIVKETESYVLRRQTDERLSSDYLSLWGVLSDGNFVLIRSALESIRDAAAISNRFLILTGGLVILALLFVVYVLTKRLTAPIKRLTDISRQMTKLDFNVRYEGRSSREVDELGMHMNELSEALLKTIEELKTANNKLEQDIRQKTEIDEMRKEFLSNVSHELKTPLALILGYAEGLKEGIAEDPESRDYYLDVIIDETERMNRMVKALLTLNNIEFGRDKIEMKRFDLTALTAQILDRHKLTFEQKGIRTEFSETKACFVYGDEFGIDEVLTNYLTNAVHFCEGEKQIRVSFTRENGRVRVAVSNTGRNIPEEEIDKIWIKFYKVDKARTREYGGSGIGLSIVKAIMDAMNQTCGARNLPYGVEFYFTLEAAS